MKLIKKIDLLILRAFAGPFIATFVLSMFLFLIQFLWKYIDELVGKGVSGGILAELIFYSLADLVLMALPLTIMVAGLMTFGNLSENFSLVALKSSGVSLLRIMRPLLLFMTLVMVGNFYFMNIIIPKAHLEGIALLWDLRQKKPAFNIDEGVFYKEIDDFAIRLGKKEPDNETVHDITIYQYKRDDDSKLLNVMRAKDGVMKLTPDKRTLIFNLENGIRYDEMTNAEGYAEKKQFNTMYFKKQLMSIDLSALDLKFTQRQAYSGDHAMMNINELQNEIDTMNMERDKRLEDTKLFWGRHIHFPGLFTFGYRNEPYNPKVDSFFKNLSSKKDILDQFGKENKSQILNIALSNARSLNGAIEGTQSSIESNLQQVAPFKNEWHKKFTLSSICMLLFIIAAPLGAIIKKGGIGLPLVISVLLFVLFYAINLVGEKLGTSGVIPVWLGAWLSSIILFPIGIWIFYKATQDSQALSIEAYGKVFKTYISKPLKKLFNRN